MTSDEETALYSCRHLNETPGNRERCLRELKRWLNEEEAWIRARTDDRHLLPFLRTCKFNLDKTKLKIVNFYTMRRDRPEWFDNRDPTIPIIAELTKLGVFVPLKKTHENRMVVIIRTAAHDPKAHKFQDVLKTGKMILEVACAENPNAHVYGVTAIFDMKGISFGHYRCLTPTVIRDMVRTWQNYHVSPKRLEFINAPSYMNVAISVFKGFMTEKMRRRVVVHYGTRSTLEDVVSKEVLPVEYGGTEDGLKELCDYWHDKMVQMRDWFAEDDLYKARSRET
ncbi:retinol-binding protein pinta-like [Cylas formicarius]|uniref:retinol-binding protein pinta-like n=1 Tax=Cylas formicarius TaxID=197179 RepID=UPI0029583567|nr:retinol-binding protein pinta-like [Cylas formicarius]